MWSGRAQRADLLRPRLRRWSSPLLQALRERYPFLGDNERTAARLAHGERQILELALALLERAAPAAARRALRRPVTAGDRAGDRRDPLGQPTALGATIVVIEHDMSLVRKLADHVFVLHNGRLLAQGSVAEIQANAAVKAIYVGAEK